MLYQFLYGEFSCPNYIFSSFFFFSVFFFCSPLLQKRQGQLNPKYSSEQFNPGEDGGSGFRMEPSRGTPQDGLSRSGQLVKPGAFGSLINEGEALMDSQQPLASSKNGPVLRTQKSFRSQGLGQFSRFSNSVAARGSSRFDMSRETSGNPHWPEERLNGRYNGLDDAGSSVGHDWSHHLLEVPKSYKKDEQAPGKESTAVNDQLFLRLIFCLRKIIVEMPSG